MPDNPDGWGEWSRYVLKTLERLDEDIKESAQKVGKDIKDLAAIIGGMRKDIAMLQVKAGIWGAVGAMIPVIGGLGIWFLTK